MGDTEVSGSGQRRAKRIVHHYIVRARQIKPPAPADDWEISTVRDISTVGIMFYSSHRYELGSELEIRVKQALLPHEEARCWGIVVRCAPAPNLRDVYEVAANFTKIDEETKGALYKSIDFFVQKAEREEKEKGA